MRWVNLLHFYQPADQYGPILLNITNESYYPLLKLISEILPKKGGSMTININAALLQMWDQHEECSDVLKLLGKLLKDGVVELTASGMYHPFLPLLPPSEMKRQIDLNLKVSRDILGDVYKPKGFFPPEMGYSDGVMEVLSKYDFEWMVLDEIAYKGTIQTRPITKPFIHKDSEGVKVVFAQRPPGYLGIMRGAIMNVEDFHQRALKYLDNEEYLVTATDAEIYGHHRPDQEKRFAELISMSDVQCISYSKFCDSVDADEGTRPMASSWSTLPQEMKEGRVYPFWDNPRGVVHKYLRKLFDLAIEVVTRGSSKDLHVRGLLDKIERSDIFWWSSQYKFWWSTEVVEESARDLLNIILKSTPDASRVQSVAKDLYKKVVLAAVEWGSSDERVKNSIKDDSRMKSFEKRLEKIF